MKEHEIRKRDVFDKYLEMVAEDVKGILQDNVLEYVNCPACAGSSLTFEFEKLGFKYVTCNECLTLFVNPRPTYDDLKEFYARSQSTSFWINDFFKPVAEARREKIFRPRAEYVGRMIDEDASWRIGDIGAGFGLFLEELRKIRPGCEYVAIEPSNEMAVICREKNFEVQRVCLEDTVGLDETFDLLTAFELFDHLQDPFLFLKKACALLKTGGHLFFTTLNGRGFDILLLWEKSDRVCPPLHLNLFNTSSSARLLKRSGFSVVETATPGLLDWDIVETAIENEDFNAGRFWNLVAELGTEQCKNDLQRWIERNKFSSHMRVLARKS